MRVLYIATSFTALTHTFITREIAQLRDQGVIVELLALRAPRRGAAASNPECDVSGTGQMYPVSPLQVLAGTLFMLVRRPRRMAAAFRYATASRLDSPGAKLRLIAQACVTTTQVLRVERLGIDHIHAHFATSPATFAMFLSVLTGKPFSLTGHAADVFRDRIALDTKLRLAGGVIAISRYNQQHFGCIDPRQKNVQIVHCGLDLRKYPFHPRTGPRGALRIVSVGRCVPKKGFACLLQALAQLNDRGVSWEAELIGEGPDLPSLKRLAVELHLDRLQFPGPLQQGDIQERLRCADVFVLPCVKAADGDVDGIPVSLMEAMAFGCPVISTRISGIPELVKDGESGLLVAPGDAAALVSALESIAREDGLSRQLSQGGRAMIEREFNILVTGPQLERFFAACSRLEEQPCASTGAT